MVIHYMGCTPATPCTVYGIIQGSSNSNNCIHMVNTEELRELCPQPYCCNLTYVWTKMYMNSLRSREKLGKQSKHEVMPYQTTGMVSNERSRLWKYDVKQCNRMTVC